MNAWANITYRGFYDVPRIFLVTHNNTQYLFSCPFNENIDDYPDTYKVYAMPPLSQQDLECDWEKLQMKAYRLLGEIPVAKVRFDPSLRKMIDTEVIDSLLAATVVK